MPKHIACTVSGRQFAWLPWAERRQGVGKQSICSVGVSSCAHASPPHTFILPFSAHRCPARWRQEDKRDGQVSGKKTTATLQGCAQRAAARISFSHTPWIARWRLRSLPSNQSVPLQVRKGCGSVSHLVCLPRCRQAPCPAPTHLHTPRALMPTPNQDADAKCAAAAAAHVPRPVYVAGCQAAGQATAT